MISFDDIDARVSQILERYGPYLTDPRAAEEEKIAETVDILIQFVRPEAPRGSASADPRYSSTRGVW